MSTVAVPASPDWVSPLLLHAGHLAITAAHYEYLPDPDGEVELVIREFGRRVESVEVRGPYHFLTERLVDSLARLVRVRRLEFANQDVSDAHVLRLADLPRLTWMSVICSTALSESCVRVLRSKWSGRLEMIGCRVRA
jgi:hypothetical protein